MAETNNTPSRLPVSMDIQKQLTDQSALAKVFVDSGLAIGPKSIPQAMVFIMAGSELGLAPFESMNAFDIIEGKVAARANTRASMVKRSGRYNYRVIEHNEEICRIQWFEIKHGPHGSNPSWELIGESSFTIEEAHKADLTNKKNWKGYARDMLFARALSRGQRMHCPEVMGGVNYYDRTEIEDGEGDDFQVEATASAMDETKAKVAEKMAKVGKGAQAKKEEPPAEPEIIEAEIVPDPPAVVSEPEKPSRVTQEPEPKDNTVDLQSEAARIAEERKANAAAKKEADEKMAKEAAPPSKPLDLAQVAEQLGLDDMGKVRLGRIKAPDMAALGALLMRLEDRFGSVADGLEELSSAKAQSYEKAVAFLDSLGIGPAVAEEPPGPSKVETVDTVSTEVATTMGPDGVPVLDESQETLEMGKEEAGSDMERVDAILAEYKIVHPNAPWVRAGINSGISADKFLAYIMFLKSMGLGPDSALTRRREKGKTLEQAMDSDDDFEYTEGSEA